MDEPERIKVSGLQRMDERAKIEDDRREGEGQSGNEVTLKRFADYSKWVMGMISGTVAVYYPVREDITERASSLYFLVCRSLLCFTLLADLTLILLITSDFLLPGRFSKRHYIVAKILVHTIGVLMMLTSVSLLLLLNPSYAMVTILVLPVMAIVIIVFYNGINRGQAREVTDYGVHQPKLKQFFELSASVTGVAFGAMIATIFGYFNNFPEDVDVKFSKAFIFFTVISGVLVMQLTTVPPLLPHPSARSHYITFIKVLSYSLFGLLALTGLAVSAERLGVFVLLAFFPIFFAVGVWFRKEFIQERGKSLVHSARGLESEPHTTMPISIFIALMALSFLYVDQGEYRSFRVKTCTFCLSVAFMSSLSWMAIALIRPPRTQSLARAVMILSYSTIVWSAFAFLEFIFLEI